MSESKKELPIDVLPLKEAALILRAVNHGLRLKMLYLLHRKGPMAVTNLYIHLHLDQSVASQHLSVLRKAGLVRTEKNGLYVYYSVNYERVSDIQQFAKELLN